MHLSQNKQFLTASTESLTYTLKGSAKAEVQEIGDRTQEYKVQREEKAVSGNRDTGRSRPRKRKKAIMATVQQRGKWTQQWERMNE